MAAVLVVCTGNVCRSPIAEGFLRAAFVARLGLDAPEVASAGTMGWTGSGADPNSVEAAAERGIDISEHRARVLEPAEVKRSTLIIGMDTEHTRAVGRKARRRAFTLKELVRILEALPESDDAFGERIPERVAQADGLRRGGFDGDPRDEGIEDPLGMPLDAFRAVARELDEWCGRLVDGLIGHSYQRAEEGSVEV